tara:strand:+ start:32 stop:310 length:279 start_codon:yes stop_codon:yes gene_type:complete
MKKEKNQEIKEFKDKKSINRPTDKFRIGTVAVSKWLNKSKEGNEFNTFTIDISYFDDKTGQYKPASAFSKNQLVNLKLCVDKALISEVKCPD